MDLTFFIRKWSVRGGNERLATQVAKVVSARGHGVTVCCQKVDPSAAELLPSVSVERLGGISFDPTLAMWTFAHASRRRVRQLRDTRPDVRTVAFNHTVLQDVFWLGAGTHAGYVEAAGERGGQGGALVNRAAASLERRRFDAADFRRLVVPSKKVAAEAVRHYGVPEDRIRLVYNAVDLERFHPGRDDEVRARWGVGDEPVALFAGQNLAMKGLDAAVRATAAVGCRLVCASRQSPPADLPAHVIWDGERADLERSMRAADVFLLPSHYESFGLVILEAWASGLPVVTTSRVGAAELAVGTPLAALIAPDHGGGLEDALRAALQDPGGYRADAVALASQHGLQRFADDVAGVFEELTR